MTSVICMAGLDPSGHAGLSADSRALHYLGIRCLPVATTLTVQNQKSFNGHQPVPSELIRSQLDAIFETETPGAIKLGMLGSSEVAELIVDFFDENQHPIITDPVFMSSTGSKFIDEELLDIYRHEIFPISRMVTPNALEAEYLCGSAVRNPDDARTACQRIYDLGPRSVLLKGGHFQESRGTDVFYDSSGFHILKSKKLDVKARGTGCAYSSLIAGYLSLGMDTIPAVMKAKEDMDRELSSAATDGSNYLSFRNQSGGSK